MHKRIRDLRESNNYRQIDIAEKLNMSQQQYQKYESGIVTPSINILVSIADLYDVSVDYLLGRTNYKRVVQLEVMNAKNSRLTEYYNRLSLEDQDFIMGKMIELHRENESRKKENSRKNIG
ncbi:MAG: helix-turn-helix transcriptional regulator [Clostridium sp.]|nr:helix-turn-helix transcriptional regulator [Clostridium sp.]